MAQTCLHDAHRELGAVIVDFHGWDMPIRYSQIPEEHLFVRESAGLFDLCHMGRLEISGPDADAWIDRVVTIDVGRVAVGRARYGLLCNDEGGVIDDLIVYRLPDRLFLVVNASNRERVVAWLRENRSSDIDATLVDRSDELAMLAIQGPYAVACTTPVVSAPVGDLEAMKYYRIEPTRIGDVDGLIATTGYTGERGFELFFPADRARAVWGDLLQGGEGRLRPIGLGARDTLRVEAGMPLYGNELTETRSPYDAGLGGVIHLDRKTDFRGRSALERVAAAGARQKLIGLKVDSKRVARQGMLLFQDGAEIGEITSGIPSPSLGYPVALAYVDSAVDRPTGIEVDIRGRRVAAEPVPLPFVSRTRKKASQAL